MPCNKKLLQIVNMEKREIVLSEMIGMRIKKNPKNLNDRIQL